MEQSVFQSFVLDASLAPISLKGELDVIPLEKVFLPVREKNDFFPPPNPIRQGETLLACEGDKNIVALVSGFGNGLLETVSRCYFRHLALVLRPEDIIFALTGQLAILRNLNAKDIPTVKERIEIRADSNPISWTNVFRDFESQIRARVGDSVADLYSPTFSTSGPVQKACFTVALMDSFSMAFVYELLSACGIPQVVLLGTDQDWEKALAHVEMLVKEMQPFIPMKEWSSLVLEAMGKICSKEPDVEFWKEVFRHHSGSGWEGASGWITWFFPVTRSKERFGALFEAVKSRSDLCGSSRHGYSRVSRAVNTFPPSVCSASVKWDRFGEILYLRFVAGQVGVCRAQHGLQTAWAWAVAKVEEEAVKKEEQDQESSAFNNQWEKETVLLGKQSWIQKLLNKKKK